jgi:diguanylate cyclase (GGDEF)-like protein
MKDMASRLRHALPRGGSLPAEDWQRRHAGIMGLLWLNVLVVVLYSTIGARTSLVHEIDESLALVVLAALGASPRLTRKLRTICASLGLLVAAALLIHASGGLIEWHFYFFVLIIVLTLYEDWTTFLLALAFVLIHHGVLGTLDPHAVFDRPEEWAHPWLWAGIHSAFVAAAGVAGVVTWRLNEDVRTKMRLVHQELELASTTDALTGLGNRRKLMTDLADVVESGRHAVLVLLDLDGFKAYNDTFGHPAGDALLSRIGARLLRAVDGRGDVYRLGGDEFCSIWFGDVCIGVTPELLSAAAMCESGDGFAITAAYGAVAIPREAPTAELALNLADTRLYSHKDGSRTSSSVQSKNVLRQAIAELRPGLALRVDAVMVLAEEVARTLDLPPHVIEQVRLAAELHDIGKVAIPNALLDNPGPLSAEEREFVHRHATIGERIVSAAPDLAQVAPLVRSSHEHFDGSGYPDGLSAKAIPVGARIISVCDAFEALTSPRPQRPALSPSAALSELQRCAGTQFDPDVVAAFATTLASSGVGVQSWEPAEIPTAG